MPSKKPKKEPKPGAKPSKGPSKRKEGKADMQTAQAEYYEGSTTESKTDIEKAKKKKAYPGTMETEVLEFVPAPSPAQQKRDRAAQRVEQAEQESKDMRESLVQELKAMKHNPDQCKEELLIQLNKVLAKKEMVQLLKSLNVENHGDEKISMPIFIWKSETPYTKKLLKAIEGILQDKKPDQNLKKDVSKNTYDHVYRLLNGLVFYVNEIILHSKASDTQQVILADIKDRRISTLKNFIELYGSDDLKDVFDIKPKGQKKPGQVKPELKPEPTSKVETEEVVEDWVDLYPEEEVKDTSPPQTEEKKQPDPGAVQVQPRSVEDSSREREVKRQKKSKPPGVFIRWFWNTASWNPFMYIYKVFLNAVENLYTWVRMIPKIEVEITDNALHIKGITTYTNTSPDNSRLAERIRQTMEHSAQAVEKVVLEVQSAESTKFSTKLGFPVYLRVNDSKMKDFLSCVDTVLSASPSSQGSVKEVVVQDHCMRVGAEGSKKMSSLKDCDAHSIKRSVDTIRSEQGDSCSFAKELEVNISGSVFDFLNPAGKRIQPYYQTYVTSTVAEESPSTLLKGIAQAQQQYFHGGVELSREVHR